MNAVVYELRLMSLLYQTQVSLRVQERYIFVTFRCLA